MLAGERPFVGKTTTEVLTAIMINPTPDLETLRDNLPIALIDLIYRMLEKDREARIPSIRLVGAELERILYEIETDIAITVEPRTLDSQRFVVPRSTDKTPNHNLPIQITPFIGRENELSEMQRLLGDRNIRLITVVGPGGMGKTRLSLEAVAQQLEHFRNWGIFCTFGGITIKRKHHLLNSRRYRI